MSAPGSAALRAVELTRSTKTRVIGLPAGAATLPAAPGPSAPDPAISPPRRCAPAPAIIVGPVPGDFLGRREGQARSGTTDTKTHFIALVPVVQHAAGRDRAAQAAQGEDRQPRVVVHRAGEHTGGPDSPISPRMRWTRCSTSRTLVSYSSHLARLPWLRRR